MQAQAEDNLARAQGIFALYEKMKGQVAELTRSQYAIRALDWIFARPFFASTHFVAGAGIPRGTARRFLRVLIDSGILHVVRVGRGRQTGILAFRELVNVAEGREVL